MKVYLVTGGAGFIGSNLVEHLCKTNKVVVIDDLSSGFESNLPDSDNLRFINADLINFDLYSIKEQISGVIHLAAQASVPLSIEQFKNSSNTNLLGMTNIMDFCVNKSLPFVYASSSAIYGNLSLGDDKVESNDILSPYACDKHVMEEYSKMCFDTYNLSSLGLRFFNVYGPKQDPSNPYSGVISIFADQIINKRGITINGGYQTRDFIYIDDVVLCIISALKMVSEEKICDQINILTGKSFSIDFLAEEISRITGNKVEINYEDLKIGDPEKSQGTIEKIEKVLNISIKNFTDLSSGLEQTIKFIKNNK